MAGEHHQRTLEFPFRSEDFGREIKEIKAREEIDSFDHWRLMVMPGREKRWRDRDDDDTGEKRKRGDGMTGGLIFRF